jgi:VanZ family protein
MPPMVRSDLSRSGSRRLGVALWCAAWACVGAAILLSLTPQSSADPATPADKLVHLTGYAVTALCFLLSAVWAPVKGPGRLRGRPETVVAAVIGFSLCLEVAQPLVGRTADIVDGAANALGTGLAWGLWRALRGRLERSP